MNRSDRGDETAQRIDALNRRGKSAQSITLAEIAAPRRAACGILRSSA
jgi:hypothetical protein